MPDDETKETQDSGLETQDSDLESIKAQLEEEQKAKAALEETLAGKDSRIAALEAQVTEFTTQLEAKAQEAQASAAELATTKEAKGQAVTKYLNMAKALNPTIPETIIAGESIEEIDASIEKGKSIVEAVKQAMTSEAAAAKVPAGAPTRGGISTEGMSPREKIAAGISRQGRETGGA